MSVPDSLQKLLEDGVIDDIKTRLMSGKEATVYVVERQGELIAAKIYKSREQRTFKATASYTEGRNQTRNTRDKRAMGKRTAYGKELVEKNWRDMEYQALSDAWHAGVRVPEPILLYDDVLLMQLLVDELGNPAPRLADFDLPADVAELLHREIYGQVRLLLASGKVHGDLSAFNILIAEGGPTIIDMPQVVDASGNQSAAEILRRDLANVTEHLAKFDARLLRFRDCGLAMWRHYERGSLDTALDPEEGVIRGDAHRSRRVRDAERGRMGRDPGRPGVRAPVVEEPRRGSPQQQHQQQAQQQATQAQAEQRPPRSFNDEPRRGPPPQHQERPRGPLYQQQQQQAQQERRPDERPRGPLYQQQQQQQQNGQQDRRPVADERPRGPLYQQQQQQQHNGQQDRRPADERPRGPLYQQQQQQQHNGQQDRRPVSDERPRGPLYQQQQQQQQHNGQQDRRPFNDEQRPRPQQQPFNGQQDRRPFNDEQRPRPQQQQDHRPFDDEDRRGPGPRSQQPFSDEPRRQPPQQQQPSDRRPFGPGPRRPPPAIERLPARPDPGGSGEPGT